MAEHYSPGIAIKTCIYRAVINDLVRFGKFQQLKEEMSLSAGFNAKYEMTSNEGSLRVLNSSLAESALFKNLDTIDAKKSDVTRAALDKAISFSQEVRGLVEEGKGAAFQSCVVMFGPPSDHCSYEDQEKMLESFEAHLLDSAYVGFEKTVAQHSAWSVIVETIRQSIKDNKKTIQV